MKGRIDLERLLRSFIASDPLCHRSQHLPVALMHGIAMTMQRRNSEEIYVAQEVEVEIEVYVVNTGSPNHLSQLLFGYLGRSPSEFVENLLKMAYLGIILRDQ